MHVLPNAASYHLCLSPYSQTACVQGKVVQALQCAQRHQLTSVDPDAFLSKAAETGVSLNKCAVGHNNHSHDCHRCIPFCTVLQPCYVLQPLRCFVLTLRCFVWTLRCFVLIVPGRLTRSMKISSQSLLVCCLSILRLLCYKTIRSKT